MLQNLINAIYPVSSGSLKLIEEITEYEDYNPNDIFIRKDKPNNKEYFVIDGICRSFLYNPEGEEITIAFFATNSVLSPFVTRTVRGISNLNFQALTSVKLGAIDAEKFETLMVDYMDIRNFGNMVLKIELQNKVNKEIGLASLTAKERLLIFRKQFPMFENLIPHTAIATYLGITNISLSRLRKNLL